MINALLPSSHLIPVTILLYSFIHLVGQYFLSIHCLQGTRHPVGEGNGTSLQNSCLENPMDRGAWMAAVHGVTEGRTRLSDFTFTFHFPALGKEMAAHSSVLAWRIPGMGEPGGLPSKGSHRVGHDWSDLAAAAGIQWCTRWIRFYFPRFTDEEMDSGTLDDLPVITRLISAKLHLNHLFSSLSQRNG